MELLNVGVVSEKREQYILDILELGIVSSWGGFDLLFFDKGG